MEKKNEADRQQLDAPLPTLEELGIEQLYTPPTTPTGSKKHSDRAFALKKMAKSLLLNFLELVGIMSVNPEQVRPFSTNASNSFAIE